MWSVTVLLLCGLAMTSAGEYQDPNARNLYSVDTEMLPIQWLCEASLWPKMEQVRKGDLQKVEESVALWRAVIREERFPKDADRQLQVVRGWRSLEDTGFLEFNHGGMNVYVRDLSIARVSKGDHPISGRWIIVVCNAVGSERLVDASDEKSVRAFVDGVLSDEVCSKAADYSNVKDQEEPVFMPLGRGYVYAYPVKNPMIDGVCVWTDGKSVVIAMQRLSKRPR